MMHVSPLHSSTLPLFYTSLAAAVGRNVSSVAKTTMQKAGDRVWKLFSSLPQEW